ncbi:MAG: Phage head-tail joining protein [Syntrophorhabdus sp. PtaU1.Bin153]|nr:MAG: Phage head-tail joining protein [Syntrophorhabdus sp. PtaU1.Bin153]
MTIGAMNKRITIQHSTRIADGLGGWTISWADTGTVWAAIWPVSASEQVKAMGQTMTITHRIRIRHRGNIRASHRIKYGNRYFNIVAITNPNEANEYLDILAKEAA